MPPPLLFLAHRIPYPPDKGDKIRSWNILRHLAARYEVHLGAFVDAEEDWQHTPILEEICASCHFVRLNPATAKLRSLKGFVTGEALNFPYYESRDLAAWVDRTAAAMRPVLNFGFSGQVAPFLLRESTRQTPTVIDFVDVDSDKWAQYAAGKRFPMSWVYAREARKLEAAEARIARSVGASLFVSEAEAALFRQRSGLAEDRVFGVRNGVDLEWFDPAVEMPNPYAEYGDAPILTFAGAMDYWANVDAVQWFADEVFPRILKTHPHARFVICGARPTAEVQALASRPNIVVTGRVDDIRPHVRHASISVASLRIARGIQNKVLEAMALARPVVCTPQALEGIDATPDTDLALADTAERFAETVIDLLANPTRAEAMGERARQRMVAAYGWPAQMAALDAIIARLHSDRRDAAASPFEETAA